VMPNRSYTDNEMMNELANDFYNSSWGVDIKETSSKYFIAHSLERNGLCVFKEEKSYSVYCGGPYRDKEEAEAFMETIEAIDNVR